MRYFDLNICLKSDSFHPFCFLPSESYPAPGVNLIAKDSELGLHPSFGWPVQKVRQYQTDILKPILEAQYDDKCSGTYLGHPYRMFMGKRSASFLTEGKQFVLVITSGTSIMEDRRVVKHIKEVNYGFVNDSEEAVFVFDDDCLCALFVRMKDNIHVFLNIDGKRRCTRSFYSCDYVRNATPDTPQAALDFIKSAING